MIFVFPFETENKGLQFFYVTGNHEWWSGQFNTLEKQLNNIGVHVIRNTSEEMTIETDSIQIIGIDDPANGKESDGERFKIEENMTKSIEKIKEDDDFQILLSHRPELLSLYSEYEFDVGFA